MKKYICGALLIMVVGLAACARNVSAPAEAPVEQPAEAPVEQESEVPVASTSPIKIGIITGTASQGEEEFMAAQNMKAKYGDMIELATYPDDSSQQEEALIDNAMALAENGVEAIVFCQAVQGTAAAIDRVRESYPDMLFICGVSADEPAVIASKADIVMNIDEVGMGVSIIEQAKKMGAKTFVHYTFPRHMSFETLSLRRDILRETCEANGIQFIDATAPDPTDEGGVAGAQQFIIEDVPRMVGKLGKDTAFFNTSCVMQVPLIKMVLQEGALYPQQCCPSPYHAYPEALDIAIASMPEYRRGDVAYIIEQIEAELTKKGGNGRFSTWPIPVNMLFVEAGVEYAKAYLQGDITDRNDTAVLEKICRDIIGDAGTASFSNYQTPSGETLANFYFVLSDYINF